MISSQKLIFLESFECVHILENQLDLSYAITFFKGYLKISYVGAERGKQF